jgi:hypothetical protein
MSYSDALEQQVSLWSTWRQDRGFTGSAASALESAETYWLAREVDDLVWAGVASMPESVVIEPDLLPSPSGFISLECPRRVVVNDGDRGILRALQWSEALFPDGGHMRRGVGALSYIQPLGVSRPMPAYFSSLIYGETVREAVERELRQDHNAWDGVLGVTHDLTPDDEDQLASQMLLLVAFWLFVRQKILVAHATSITERHARKRIERLGWQSNRGVRVVQLRRRETQHLPDATDGSSHDWSCQWLVRGHWRQQFYPSQHAHQPLWITPYVKGPDDKPLKPPRTTVFAVVR